MARKGATFKSLVDTWANTTTPHGRLVLTVLGGLAEFERELIRARTSEGRRRTVEAGVKPGRRSSLSAYRQAEVIKRRAEGESLTVLAKSYGVTHPTIIRALQRHEAAAGAAMPPIRAT